MVQWLTNLTSIHKDAGSIPGLVSGLRIRCCCELWCRSQTWLGSLIALVVAVASSCSSDSALSLGTSICCGCGSKNDKKKKKATFGVPWWLSRLRIWHYHCCGMGLIPGQETSACWEYSQKTKNKKKKAIFKTNDSFFKAAPVACGSSQARDRIRAAAAGLHHSHSNSRSEPPLWPMMQLPHLWPTMQLVAALDP